ncbi:pyruvate, phosphate dikinase [Candidatus Woesearchaeota archaeon]|nr:MAG: pyruvate, phosphate dikinase [Candidatus Woesearchaeota archaeon]
MSGNENKNKFVYFFGDKGAEGNASMKDLLGGKGANLAEMSSLGVPVPPGFTISTEACALYQKDKKTLDKIWGEVLNNLSRLEKVTGKKFGSESENPAPLLVSVRSGAAISMPGMMDTILNVGLNDSTVQVLASLTQNRRFAYDAYRRLIQMFGDVVMGVEHALFENILEQARETRGVEYDYQLLPEDLELVISKYKELVKKETGKEFPQDVMVQLRMAVEAVFNSWNNERAIAYRKIHNITGLKGTAVNVQSMVFGNMGDDSGTGVCFTRSPSTGENKFYGEFLVNAQGEDVVAGIRTPEPVEKLKEKMPLIYEELVSIARKLESHFRDMQDIEFTIENGKLFILQSRTGKRTAAAALKIAIDMVNEELISKEEAVLRVQPEQLDQLLHKQFDRVALEKARALARGLPASPGAAVGRIVFDAETAVEKAKEGEKVILVRTETSPEDISGMSAASGILTSRGGMTSHAAVVARGMGKCCVAGCQDAAINEDEKTLKFSSDPEGRVFKEGDFLSIDGSTGRVYEGELPTVDPELTGDFKTLMEWADSFRRLNVRTNADTPHDSKRAVEFGAEGIGLCRTEHMFFEGKRIVAVREMILAETPEEREKALNKILPFQRDDFVGIFMAMEDRPVTIRLLDPPLHEFLPSTEHEIKEVASEMNVSEQKLRSKVEALKEFNPMLGHRGCRLGITFPEITRMQSRAIFEAALIASEKLGRQVKPEIMVPLVGNVNEFVNQKKVIDETADAVFREKGKSIPYLVGTMIEVPRAALTADEIAQEAEFFSFGTNDLTQMTMGFSRDDAGKFLPHYIESGILHADPFATLDTNGVGKLVEMGVKLGRKSRPNLKVGICGEHGGDPASIEFCHKAGLDYVSCSPFRVPIARLAAAQAALKEK